RPVAEREGSSRDRADARAQAHARSERDFEPGQGVVSDLAISPITDTDVDAVISLWQRCGLTRPWNDPAGDIAFVRRGANATILVGRADGAIVASTMVGHDGHRGWVYYVAVDPQQQRRDFGRAIMAAAEDWLRGQGV